MKSKNIGEYVTFFISLVIVLGLATYLIKSIISDERGETLNFESRVLWEETSDKKNGSVVVPIEIKNNGKEIANSLVFQIIARGEELNEEIEVRIEYLDPYTPKKIYLTLPSHPYEDGIIMKPLYHQQD